MNATELVGLLLFTFFAGWWAHDAYRWYAWRRIRGRRAMTARRSGVLVRVRFRTEGIK